MWKDAEILDLYTELGDTAEKYIITYNKCFISVDLVIISLIHLKKGPEEKSLINSAKLLAQPFLFYPLKLKNLELHHLLVSLHIILF